MFLLKFIIGMLVHHLCWARMEFVGPFVTMTLKDPSLEATRLDGQKHTLGSKKTTTTTSSLSSSSPWWSDLRSLNPQIYWSIQSRSGQPPLPNWFPQLKFLRATIGYNTESISEKFNGSSFPGILGSSFNSPNSVLPDIDILPSTVLDTEIRLARDGWGELDLQPSYDFQQRKWTSILQATRGSTARLWMKLSWGGRKSQTVAVAKTPASTIITRSTNDYDSFIWPSNIGTSNSASRSCIEFLQGNFVWNLRSTSLSSLSAIKMSPSYDFSRRLPSCSLEGITGSGRTKAILNLQYHQPTLSIVHAIDDRNIISPEISLNTAKILYHWNIRLESGTIRTKVDPTEAIHVSWTDRTKYGRWVTDFSFPLKGTTLSLLAAQIRIRRQFTF